MLCGLVADQAPLVDLYAPRLEREGLAPAAAPSRAAGASRSCSAARLRPTAAPIMPQPSK